MQSWIWRSSSTVYRRKLSVRPGLRISRFYSSSTPWPALPELKGPSLEEFQAKAWTVKKPFYLSSSFDLPASRLWVDKTDSAVLNEKHFAGYQNELFIPIELTTTKPSHSFARTTAPLSLFLAYLQQVRAIETGDAPRMYIAQAPLNLLPENLKQDIPTPDYVLKSSKGDIYDSSLWMGPAIAARTPLHRDPNPNILVQVAGRKAVRLLPPGIGREVLEDVRAIASRISGNDNEMGTMRGEEMMGEEGRRLDKVIWDNSAVPHGGHEAILEAGDGIFIPEGWWHSIRGLGDGINISVNWWFR